MGGEGGSVITKRSIIEHRHSGSVPKVTRPPSHEDTIAECRGRWRYCALSQKLLWPPIVADKLGNIFRKDAVVEFLLSGQRVARFEHISKLRDVKELRFVDSFQRSAQELGESPQPASEAAISELIVCPISGQVATSGCFPFVFFWECGHVVSQHGLDTILNALKLVASKDGATPPEIHCPCDGCETGVTIVKLLPSKEDSDRLQVQIIDARNAERASRKRSRQS